MNYNYLIVSLIQQLIKVNFLNYIIMKFKEVLHAVKAHPN